MKSKIHSPLCRKLFIPLLLVFMGGCAVANTGYKQNQNQNTRVETAPFEITGSTLPSPLKRQLVAIAGFENKSTYSADKLWDTSGQLLAAAMIRSRYFRVVEWERMKTLFDWDTLSTVNLIKSPENMKKAQRILLCEYFISGAITYFDVSQKSQVSAMSKAKTYETTIRVDLLMQNAKTGEYLATGKGEHSSIQVFQGTASGGQTGTWSPKAADSALNSAIQKALFELINTFHTMNDMAS